MAIAAMAISLVFLYVSLSLLLTPHYPVSDETPPADVSMLFFTKAAAVASSGYDSEDQDSDSDADNDRFNDRRTFFPSYASKFSPYSMAKPTGPCLPPGATEFPVREVWQGKENADGLFLRLDMPGVGRDDIKVWVEKDTLVMKGKGEKDFEEIDEVGPTYDYKITLLEIHRFNINAFKAKMVKGVLKVFVPKLK